MRNTRTTTSGNRQTARFAFRAMIAAAGACFAIAAAVALMPSGDSAQKVAAADRPAAVIFR